MELKKEKLEKRCFVSPDQKKILIETVKNDPELLKAKFSPTFTFKMAKERWENVANELNAIPGAQKTGEQWKRSWQDFKKAAKKKQTQTKNIEKGTGGGPPPNLLSKDEEEIIGILDPTAVEGDPNIIESIVNIICEDDIIPKEYLGSPPIGVDIETKDDEVGKIIAGSPSKINRGKTTLVSKETIHVDNVETTNKKINIVIKKDPTIPNVPLKRKINRTFKSRNLENSIKTSSDMLTIAKADSKIKENYYEKKIKILSDFNEKKLEIDYENLKIEKQKLKLKQEDIEIKKSLIAILEKWQPRAEN